VRAIAPTRRGGERWHLKLPVLCREFFPIMGEIAFGSASSGQWLGRNPDPDTDPDNRQRYDDHQQVDRQPSGYALCRLGHSVCPRRPRYVRRAQVAVNEFTCLGDLIDPPAQIRRRRFQSCADVWRENTNYWRAITRLGAGVPVAHQHRRVPHARLNQRHLAEPNYDPRRRAVWLSLAGLFASFCATIWVLFPL
jgi:hypothetical protein